MVKFGMEKFHTEKSNEPGIPENFDPLAGPEQMTRRRFLRDALAASGVVLVPLTTKAEAAAEEESSIERAPFSFELYQTARQMRVSLRRDQVIATTSRGELIAGPIDLESALGWEVKDMVSRTERNGGELQGIPGRYLNNLRDQIREENDLASDEVVQIEHVYLDLQQINDPTMSIADLAQQRLNSLPHGEDDTYAELIQEYFKPTLGGSESGQFIASSLKNVLPSLITKESMFSRTAVSSNGARAELQILPGTFERYAGVDADPTHVPTQLEVASRYFEASYRYLTTNLRNELDVIRTAYFADNEVAFTEHFLFPLLVNAYNAGDGNMTKVVQWFTKEYYEPERLSSVLGEGQSVKSSDVYYIMATLAREQKAVPSYGPYASDYALDIIATAPIINNSATNNIQIASSN